MAPFQRVYGELSQDRATNLTGNQIDAVVIYSNSSEVGSFAMPEPSCRLRDGTANDNVRELQTKQGR
jgi:hypothetical protein